MDRMKPDLETRKKNTRKHYLWWKYKFGLLKDEVEIIELAELLEINLEDFVAKYELDTNRN